MTLKKCGFYLTLTGITILGITLALELFLQFNSYKIYLHRYPQADRIFEMVPFLQIQPRTNSDLHVNYYSFRGEEIDEAPDVFTIFVFGGSTTFCASTPYEKTYPALLQKHLRAHYPGVKIQVMNAACDWYSTEHSIIRLLFKARHFHPELVIMMEAINDLMRSFVPNNMSFPGHRFRRDYTHYLGALATYGVDPDQLGVPFRKLLLPRMIKKYISTLMTGRNPSAAVLPLRSEPVSVKQFKSLPIYEQNIAYFIKIAEMLKARVLLLTQPNLYSGNLTPEEQQMLYFPMQHMMENYRYPDLESLERGMKEYNQTMMRVAQKMDIPLVDLDSQIPKNAAYFYDDVHPKEVTLEMEAKLIADKIISSEMIDDWKKTHLVSVTSSPTQS